MQKLWTTREIAEMLDVDVWRIQRLYESGDLREPTRFGGKRAIPATQIPALIDALRDRGWLPAREDAICG